jgi:Fe-S cluster biogenesis protein NfuA
MFIQTEATPNPATLKFLPGNTVLGSGTADFPSKDTSEKSPLASKIFQVEGVAAVFLGTDFITVTKNEEIDWDHIKSSILGSIMEHYQSGEPAMTEEAIGSGHATHSDTRVRPAVAQDGGDIVFHGFESGVVYLHMQGACAGCPSSTLTLKMGIENLLRHYIPEVLEVRPVAT